jgi:hypothetical protein
MTDIVLVSAPHLMEAMRRGPERRPWRVGEENVEKLREVLPKWMDERHGIVVYENKDLSSSGQGDLSFAPRMFDSVEKGWAPAQLHPQMETIAGTTSYAVDWIGGGWIHEPWFGLPTNEIIDACFYYEVGRAYGPHQQSSIAELRIFARENGIAIKGSAKQPIWDAIDDWITGHPVARHHLMSGKLWED